VSDATLTTYADASDADVLRNYEAACAAEVEWHERRMPAPAIVTGAADAWMREGMRRGIL
jgi:hypothetical protein